jgi:adenylate cyclase
MARAADPVSLAVATAYKYVAIGRGVLLADDIALTDINEALQLAERCSEDLPMVLLRMSLGIALTHRDSADRARGLAMLAEVCDTCITQRYALNIVAGLQLYLAQEAARESPDRAIDQARTALENLFSTGNFINCDTGTMTFVELLLARGTDDDLTEAGIAIDRLAETLAGCEWATRDVVMLRLRALVAQARGDESTYRDFRDRYRAMATELGFEGHMAWAAEMP